MPKTKSKKQVKSLPFTPLEINKLKKKITYNIHPESSQKKYIDKVFLEGYTSLPSGFYKEGYGFTSGGQYILQELFSQLGQSKLNITITKDGTSKLIELTKSYKIVFSYKDLSKILTRLREIKRIRNEELKKTASDYLNLLFPKYITGSSEDIIEYKADQLTELLNEKTIKKLSSNDIQTLQSLLPLFLQTYFKKARKATRLPLVQITKKRTEKIFIDTIIKEFENSLTKNKAESYWQDFLNKYLLLLNTSYTSIFEKSSISIEGKYPDFLLFDMLGYVDIFEIKKPSTKLLKFDNSRNNYFWHDEVNKAIAQVEKYIDELLKNSDALYRIFSRKGINVNIIRPRGYIIVGKSLQLTTNEMKDGFRILSQSLKNIEILLYDDLLNRLKNLQSRLA